MASTFFVRFPYCRFLPKCIIAVLISGLSAPGFSAEAALTLEQAQRLAIERSRQIDARDFGALASREMAVAARQLPDPVLRAGVDNVPINGSQAWRLSADDMTMRRIGVMRELTRSDKRKLRSRRFELQAEEILADKGAVSAAVERDTARAWLNRYYAESMAILVSKQRERASLELDAAQAAYRGGRGTQAEIVAARSAIAEIDNRGSEIAARIRNANLLLARWVGEAATLPLAGQPAINVLPFDPALLEAHLVHHPEIAALVKREEIAATEVRLAQAEKQVDWSVELMVGQRGGGMSDMVSLGVSIPLQWNQGNRQDREVVAKLAMAEQVQAERDDALRSLVAEVGALLNNWQDARERHARYVDELIPLAAQRADAALAAYRGGKSSLSEVLAARRNEIDVRLQALALQMDAAQHWAELAFLFPSSYRIPPQVEMINRDMK